MSRSFRDWESERKELINALREEHRKYERLDCPDMLDAFEWHIKHNPDCPTCQLIKRLTEE